MSRKISFLTILFLLIFSFTLPGCLEEDQGEHEYFFEVNGGLVIKEKESRITIRSYSPDTDIKIEGFKGKILLTNCHKDSEVKGVGDSYEIRSTNITIDIGNEKKKSISVDAKDKDEFRFAVIGDTQGMNHIFMDAVKEMEDVDFLIHLGDLTASGKRSGYDSVKRVMNSTDFPVYSTIGNHDIRFDGKDIYENRLSPLQYSFSYSNYNFIFFNSAELSLRQEQVDWMRSEIEDDKENVLITHAPYFDPFGGSHTMDEESCNMMDEFVSEHDVHAYLSGHIHAYHQDISQKTKRLITGGGGGSLVKGEHHFVYADASNDNLEFTKVPIDTEEQNVYKIFVKKGGKNVTYTYQNLLYKMDSSGVSSFQNQFGNIRGKGYYEGVKFRALLEKVGGMSKNDTLVVESIDGYKQKFGYLNVYPNEEFMRYQGEFILALEYNNKTIDDWEDGPRAVMIPGDGYYSNDDCANTSYPGQGWNVYESAGARWAKYVKMIEVIEDG